MQSNVHVLLYTPHFIAHAWHWTTKLCTSL